MKIAVVRNEARDGVINDFGTPCPEKYGRRTVAQVVEALEAGGHRVTLLEGDKTLLTELESFAPPDPQARRPTALVVNMAYGIQGESRYTHVPAMLELAGVPYTGASPLGHAVSLDKAVTKRLLHAAGVPTPAFVLMEHPQDPPPGLHYPLIVKPRRESTSYGLTLAHDRRELDDAVRSIVGRYGQAALVEQYIDGREVCAALLGNDPPHVLPAVELSFDDRGLKLMTWDDKYHRRADEPRKLCPAPLRRDLLRSIEQIARMTFECCHARDYARVDIRIDEDGQPWVLELNSMASLGAGGSYMRAAQAAGYSYETLVNRIVDIAHERYYRIPAPRGHADLPPHRSAHRTEIAGAVA